MVNSKLTSDERQDLFMFLESLANSSYINFHNIKISPIVEVLFTFDTLSSVWYTHLSIEMLQKLDIDPEEYMRLIYNLTQDWTRRDGGSIQEYKVKSMQDQSFISVEQILTEFGICYGTNNYLLTNISTQ